MNILIIEDDIFLAEKIKHIFENKIITNRIYLAHSKEDFYNYFSIISSFDIILTDLKLSHWQKEKQWYEIIQKIREKNITIPIVVISASNEIDCLRLAFEYGASDYIIKPIRLKELEVRVMNWFSNYYLSQIHFVGRVYYYKELSYHIDNNEFYFCQKLIPLTKNNKYLLSIFFSNQEKILKEDFLVEKIRWDIVNIIERSLRVNILRLKKWLKPFWIDHRIHNIRWEWYQLIAK